ncbi:Outer membrane protein A precursor [Labilithrix luteola]|uniref:Outer membrane protein A n=1 Tax=Labilithrix luteola TaxID=1391654 RepID=A0A0K1PXS4_9BACT|nr:OmpA family protein [Labilithrix luteola]AKU98323.1 Outer membrane protein A precursor [Labilithrix luteola]
MKRMVSVLTPPALAALAFGVLAGCAGNQPPPTELRNARAAYHRAASDPVAQYNESGLIESRQALDVAERQYEDSPKSQETKTAGYVAERQAQVAEANARTSAATQEQLQKEQRLAGKSERRADIALERLGLAAKDEPRGTVITLPEANMFDTNKAVIRPEAKARLTEVAKAVKSVAEEGQPQDQGRTMTLIGYTDSTGSDERNATLSKERSDAVRTFFGEHGLNEAKIQTEGRGEADPVADNGTKEGRAQNRRVEIVISPPTHGGTMK